MRSINVISRRSDAVIESIATRLACSSRAGSLGELHEILAAMSDQPVTEPSTLDLLGHSTRGEQLLRLGDTVINMFDPAVERFFDELGDSMLLHELGIVAVRLLGCSTATKPCGQRTILRLARTLQMPVFGARKALIRDHYDELGLRPEFAPIVLVDSRQLANPTLALAS